MNDFTVFVCGMIVALTIGCAALGIPTSIGKNRGHAEATCWAKGVKYVDTTDIGVVCSDGTVVPGLAPPGADTP